MKNILRHSNFGFTKWCVALIAAGWVGAVSAQAQSDLVITGIIDAPRTGGLPKAIEIYVINSVADLSIYKVQSYINGGTTPSAPLALTGSATAGQYFYVASESPEFTAYFGFAPNVTGSVLNVNGDDVVALTKNDTVVDVFGTIGVRPVVDATFNYQDTWFYRKSNTVPSPTFNLADWTFPTGQSDALDSLGATGANPVVGNDLRMPIGTFTSGSGGTPPTVTGISPASGLAGTIVTITGTDFTGATAVRFNGVAATSFTVDSATSITATVPTSATTGPIYVTTTGGTGSSSGNFTVPVLSIAVSGGNSINEGDNTQKATVTATPAPTSDLTITLTSSSAADLTVDGGSGAGASSTATIFANTTEASFFLNAPADNTIDNNASVNLTATAVSGYGSGTAIVTVRNVDFNPPTIVVNKAYNSGLANGADDVVELLVIGNGTPGSTLNLQGMILKDYSDSGASDQGGAYIFSNAPLWSSVKAGTLIVLTKPGTTLPAEDVDTADFVIKVNLSTSTYFTAGTDNFNLGGTDLIQIKAPSSAQAGSIGVIHSFAIGTTSAAQVDAAPLPKLICFNSGNNPFAISSTKTLADFNGTGAAQSASPLGMGIPNNTDNATYISSLRGSPSNSAPTGISLSSLSIAENNAVNAVVGTLSTTDADSGDTFTYSLVAGTGSTDNASFNISGSSLRAGVDFNFEALSSYSIRVRTTDSVGSTFEKVFEITVTNVTDSPAEYKADWLAANGLPAGSSWNSDPNNVGYSLATAYAFGLSPIVRSGVPVTLVSSSAGSVKVVYLQRDISSGVTYAVKTGTDLSAGLNGSVTPTPSTVQPSPGKIGYTQYEATYTPAAPATKGFLKVQAFVP